MQRETRMVIQELGPDGQWETVGVAGLDAWESSQIALVLAGVDPAVYAALSPAAQQRIDRRIGAGVPPALALD